MIPSILQVAATDPSTGDDATRAVLGLLSAGRSFELFLQRAAPPIDTHAEQGREPGPPDPPLAILLGILAFNRHLTARLNEIAPERKASSEVSAREPPLQAHPAPPRPRGLLR
jgi:hypothetical protein